MEQRPDFTAKRRLMDIGSIVSALGLAAYFVGRALHLPALATGIMALAGAAVAVATLLGMIACRQDGGKEVVSGNRIVGQAALGVLSALAAAVVLKGG